MGAMKQRHCKMTLQDDIAKLAFAGRIDVQVPTAADGSWDQIVIPEEIGSRITYDTRKHMLSFIAPVGSSEFNRILRLNIGTIFEKPLRDAYGVHKARDPLLAVTCRESAEIRLPHAFLRLRLEPFTDVQMHLFFQRWLHRTGFSAEPILQLLNQNANLREICRTPIIASIVAGLHEGGSDLPRSRTEVYQKRFELLLRRWDAVKQVRRQTVVRPEDKLRFLAEVAFHVHSKHHRVFTSSDAKEVWNQSLAVAYENVDFNDVMVEIQRVHDVAPYQGRGEYSLGHLSFQEYLCAYNCVNRQRSVFLIKHLGDPWWRRVCVFFVGITGDASPFMDAIVGSVELFANRDFLHKLRSEAAFTSKAALDFLHDSSDSDGEDSTYNDTHENLKSGSKIEDGEDAWDTGIDDDLELDADSLGEDDDVP